MLQNSTEASVNRSKSESFLLALKQTTAKQHSMLEGQELLTALMNNEVTIQQYYHYLLLMQSIHTVYEKKVLPQLTFLFPEILNNKASQLIADDMQSIECTSPNTVCHHDFMLAKEMSIAFALGFMYVMEGSKLGGKVIYKHIHNTLHLSQDKGAKFIADYGADTGRQWRNFLTRFSDYVTEHELEEDAIQGAIFAFTSIHDYFELNRPIYAV